MKVVPVLRAVLSKERLQKFAGMQCCCSKRAVLLLLHLDLIYLMVLVCLKTKAELVQMDSDIVSYCSMLSQEAERILNVADFQVDKKSDLK